MIPARLNICRQCMLALLTHNPYVNKQGNTVCLKNVRLNAVFEAHCDNHIAGKILTDKIVLTAIHCNRCNEDYYIRLQEKERIICPKCKSTYCRELTAEEVIAHSR